LDYYVGKFVDEEGKAIKETPAPHYKCPGEAGAS